MLIAKNTFVCVAATESLRVKKLKETGSYNIATVNWLIKAVGANVKMKKLIKFQPNDLLCYTIDVANEFERKFDKYSDSYTKKVSTDQLKALIDAMDEKVIKQTSKQYLEMLNLLLYFIEGT